MNVILRLVVAEFRMTSLWNYVVTCSFAIIIGVLSAMLYGGGQLWLLNTFVWTIFFLTPVFLVRKHLGYRFCMNMSQNRGLSIWHIYRYFAVKMTVLCWSRVMSQLCFMILFYTICLVVMMLVMSIMNVDWPTFSSTALVVSWLFLSGTMLLWYAMSEPGMDYTWVGYLKHYALTFGLLVIIFWIGFSTDVWLFEILTYSVDRSPLETVFISALLFVIMLFLTPRKMLTALEKRDARV